jgi:antitoxin (DNA-binding transcriptional repressor) of toxin-antitoxin stability system
MTFGQQPECTPDVAIKVGAGGTAACVPQYQPSCHMEPYTMKTVTIREAREGLSHPEQLFATDDEVVVTRRGEPVARILPITPKRPVFRSLAAFRATMPFQETPSEVLIRKDRDARD